LGLNSDASVKRLKGESRPLNSEQDRATVLSTLKPIDYVCIFEEDTPYELIKAVKPHVLVKGGDYNADDIVGNDIAEETVVLSFLEGRSTTRIIKKMQV
jgi:D-beta-D-heptose 7-phosphate kinase/D-beta-D-heptose 1-phosphate adenosyltransferase